MEAPPAPSMKGDPEVMRAKNLEILRAMPDADVLEIQGATKNELLDDMVHDADVHSVAMKFVENAERVQAVHPEFDPVTVSRELIDVGSDNQRLSVFLGIKEEELETQLATLEGIDGLVNELKSRQAEVAENDPTLDVSELEKGLELAKEVIRSNEMFIEDITSAEKEGLLTKAKDALMSFPKNHPFVSILLLAALAAGGVATGAYFLGDIELALSGLGLDKIFGSAGAAAEMLPAAPATPLVPGGGMFDIPAPVSPPGLGTIT